MRAVWVDAGNDADYAKLHRHGITEPIYDIRDPRITKAYLQNVANLGFFPGVHADWNWPETEDLDGPEFADWVHEELKPLHQSPSKPSVHLNDETHDPVRIIAMLERWRLIRPFKKTLWTLEGMQGGLFSPEQAKRISNLGVEIGPQCYRGDMTRMESSTVVLDLVLHDFSAELIVPFLAADALGDRWDGVAFTMGKLPS